jgi:NTE family protein
MSEQPKVAFVLGGGGILGAAEAGMLRALLDRGIAPDLVVGASVGAINGAAIAAEPTPDTAVRLAELWGGLSRADVFGSSILAQAATLFRSRTNLHPEATLRKLLARHIPEATRIEDLAVPFQCVAASIERAAEHWFTEGLLIDAVCASAAVPGLLPPVEIGGEHYFDGGLVNSIPVGRAVKLGARTVYVLHVGRIERKLEPPRTPWEVGLVAFEIARRHRFHSELASVPNGVDVHVLPTGAGNQPRYSDLSNFRYRDLGRIGDRIELAHQATLEYLDAGR